MSSWTNVTEAPSGGSVMNETTECTPRDNSLTADDATMSAYKLIMDVYLFGALCVAGWIGNALSVAMFRSYYEPNQ